MKVSLITFFASFLSIVAFATDYVDEQVVNYKVDTVSKKSLLNLLYEKSPININGHVYFGLTKSTVNWNWQYKERGKWCKITKVKTIVKNKYVLPDLNIENLDKTFKKKWIKWYDLLVKHEKNHGLLALEIASEGKNEIKKIGRKRGCDKINVLAQNIVENKLNKLQYENNKYDEKTFHGDKEGVQDNLLSDIYFKL